MPVPIYIYAIGFSILAGWINYRWLKPVQLKAFIPFLVITLLAELLGLYMKYILDQPNGMVYNLYVIFQVVFCSLFFLSFQMPAGYRRLIAGGIVVYVLISVVTYAVYHNLKDFHIGLFLAGGFLVVLFAIFFLFNYFSIDDRTEGIELEPVIWIAIGLILYFTVLSITVSLIDYILYYDLEIGGINLHNIVPRILSVVMYSCFAYSFFKCRTLNRK